MARADRPVRTEARDYLERPIEAGDWIVYTTGGTSARLVLARVHEVERFPLEENRQGLLHRKMVSDGFRGDSEVRLHVHRYAEGTDRPLPVGEKNPDYARDREEGVHRRVDTTKLTRIEQLHRVLVIDDAAAREFLGGDFPS